MKITALYLVIIFTSVVISLTVSPLAINSWVNATYLTATIAPRVTVPTPYLKSKSGQV